MGHYRNARAWQLAKRLAVLSRAAIRRLPREERDALADQWRRASYSVVLNITEGLSLRGSRELRRYLDLARASLHEVDTIVELAVELEYFRPDDVAELRATRDECARCVFGFIRTLARTTRPASS